MGGDILKFSDHVRTPSGLRKASSGTVPPEISLKRLASPRDASLRPAKILRRCDSEQSAASASSLTDRPLISTQLSMGCRSDMVSDISPGNQICQAEIFPVEIVAVPAPAIDCSMGKKPDDTTPTIYLGDWLEEFGIDNGAAAEAAGCDQSYISNIVANRKANINVLFLFRLSESMGVTVNDFYRPLPSRSHLAALKNLSPKAQATLLARFQKKG
jgi:plasmid maintenance system antidote protein VapI